MNEKYLALTLFSKLCQCRGPPKLPKTSLTHETERQTEAGGATITSITKKKPLCSGIKLNLEELGKKL